MLCVDPIRIDWGDGTIEEDMYPLSETSRCVFSDRYFDGKKDNIHMCFHPRPFISFGCMQWVQVRDGRLWSSLIVSEAGLYAFRHLVVNVTQGVGSVTPVNASVSSVASNITSYGDWRGAGEFPMSFRWNFRIDLLRCHGIQWWSVIRCLRNQHNCHCQWTRKSQLDSYIRFFLGLEIRHSHSKVRCFFNFM